MEHNMYARPELAEALALQPRRMRAPFALGALLVATSCMASPGVGASAGSDLDALKIAYLRCDRRAAESLLSFAEATDCSGIYEELKARAFAGDYLKLLTWWRAERMHVTEELSAKH